MEITKKFEFEMAHLLSNHPALCQNLHGHSYKLFVTIQGDVVDDMVADFKELKEIVNKVIVDKLDHCFAFNINTTDEFEKEVAEVVLKHNKKHYAFDFRTTCENMSKWMYELLNAEMQDKAYKVSKITLYETSGSYCEYKGD